MCLIGIGEPCFYEAIGREVRAGESERLSDWRTGWMDDDRWLWRDRGRSGSRRGGGSGSSGRTGRGRRRR